MKTPTQQEAHKAVEIFMGEYTDTIKLLQKEVGVLKKKVQELENKPTVYVPRDFGQFTL